MRGGAIIAAVLCLALFFAAEGVPGAKDYSNCLDCHFGIERLDANHAFPCRECHLLPGAAQGPIPDHSPVVRHPASPANMARFCGGCHQGEIAALKNSLHYTLAGLVNQTRYLWGAQPDPGPRYCAGEHDTLKGLPETPAVIESPAHLVDDLLTRRCLRCHIGDSPPPNRGLFRGLGCAACHLYYGDDGAYRGGDPAMRGLRGFPERHSFVRPIPSGQCFHCHNGPRVGGDYGGLFEHDYHQSFRTPVKDGLLPERIYLMDHHRLSPDVHFSKGLQCVDCHEKGDVMGRGRLIGSQQEAVEVRCLHCHQKRSGNGRRHPGVKGGRFFAKDGGVHALPRFNSAAAAHSIPGMGRVHCLGCHAGSSFMDYGPSLMRDDREDLSRWAPLRLQGDPAVLRLFDDRGRFLGKAPGPGPWLLGWRFRRWEFLTLGVDSKDRIVPMRPRYQYQVSYVNKSGGVILDSVTPARGDGSGPGWAFMPFYPHTVQRRGRGCEACHGRGLAAGDGLWGGRGPDLKLTRPSPPALPTLRLLNEREKSRLMNKSQAYRRWLYKALLGETGGNLDRAVEGGAKR